ncbi:NACHT, LRR and PYD domains-containing protein 1b allele 2 [Silurus meridionalis]|nr:NACHT, LRR and PYD domains-containing protein 1b allele 2 [Silurus meridionalis]
MKRRSSSASGNTQKHAADSSSPARERASTAAPHPPASLKEFPARFSRQADKIALHISLLSRESLFLASELWSASGGEFSSCARFIQLLTRELGMVTADISTISLLLLRAPFRTSVSQDRRGISTLLQTLPQAIQDGSASPQDLQEISALLQDLQNGSTPPQGLQEILSLLQDLQEILSLLQDLQVRAAPPQDLRVRAAPPQDLLVSSSLSQNIPVHSGETDVFTPELGKDHHEDWNSGYSFHCSGAGQFQCKYTNLVFEMKEKAEVLYSIVSWGSVQLDGMGQIQPAGPLYNIDCSKGSMCKLHLPHCEINSDRNQTELAVAHFSDGNVEIIQSLKVTETHTEIFELDSAPNYHPTFEVILSDEAEELTLGLLDEHDEEVWVSRQVFLTDKNQTELAVAHFSDGNVEIIQPLKTEIFELDSAPNYHPTFEVILPDETEELTLGLLDEHDQEVWASRQVFLTAAEFVDKHRDIMIQKVSSVMEIADGLLSKQMINDELYSTISAASTLQEKMRILYTKSLIIRAVKEEFYTILKEKHPYLVDELENGSSNA